MCKSEEWSADLDKYHRRKVHQVRVRCWYKESGCAWEGDMNGFKRHSGSCEKRPWECEYCGLKCKYGEGEGKHWGVCDKFPEPCPNGCEVGSVERCVMEEHRSVCPLEPVACEMREFGCSVVVPRRAMATHMKESEIQHLTSMTALNLRLTRQLQHNSAKMEQMITEQRKELEEQKKEMAALLEAQKKTEEEIQAKLETQKGELTTYVQKVEHSINNHMQYTVSGMHVVLDIPGTFSTDKLLYSEPFYSYHHGYKFRLGVVIIPLRFYGKSHTLADFRRQQLEIESSTMQSYHEMRKGFKMEEDEEVQRQLQEIQTKYQLAQESYKERKRGPDFEKFLDKQREKMKKEKDEVERKNWYSNNYNDNDYYDSNYCWEVKQLREKKRQLDSHLMRMDLTQLIEVGYYVLKDPALYGVQLEGKWEVSEGNSRSFITQSMVGAVFHLVNGEYDQQLSWPVKVNVQLELLNQAGDHRHLMKTKNITFTKEKGSKDDAPLFKFNTKECLIMQDRSVVYFLNSCLKFRMIICIT